MLRHGKAVASEGTVGLAGCCRGCPQRFRWRAFSIGSTGATAAAVFAFLARVVAMATAVLERYAEPGHAGGAGCCASTESTSTETPGT